MTDNTATASATHREFIFQDGSSNKFWHIDLEGSSHTVKFGRIGTNGQQATKDFANEAAARKSFDKLVAEKLGKGYTEVDTGSGHQASASTNPTPKPRVKPKAEKPKADLPAEAPPAATSPAVCSTTSLEIERTIDLEPHDWYRARFRRLAPLEREEPRPFDFDDCIARLSKLRTRSYGWDVRWQDLKLPTVLSREEAHFWFDVMTTQRGREKSPKEVAESFEQRKFDGEVSVESAAAMIRRQGYWITAAAAHPLSNLLSLAEIAELYTELNSQSQGGYGNHLLTFFRGFYEWSLPYVSTDELERLRASIRKNWDPTQSPESLFSALPLEYYLAAVAEMHDEVYEVTSSWGDDRFMAQEYGDYWQSPQDLLFGLSSPELVESEWRRLQLGMRHSQHVRAFLACTEYSALDCVRDSILTDANKEICEELLTAFSLVRAPEAAEPMLECMLSSKMSGIARDWLTKNTGTAIAGLIETAAGKGRIAEAAVDWLRSTKLQGHADLIAQCLKERNDAGVSAAIENSVLNYTTREYVPFDESSTPAWLQKALDACGKLKSAKLPTWASPVTLPPLTVGDHRLNDNQMQVVLRLLASTPVTQSHPLFKAIRENVGPSVRDEFAWKMFENWSHDGYPSKEKWAMGAIGHLGDAGCALKLTPLVRVWPGESQHARAVFGLECLRAIGSDAALMQLAGCAQKLKFKGLKAKAETFVNEIAQERGMTRAELEDRVIPDCGLDENGKREFSFGSRSFWFALGKDLKANVRDESGKLKTDLPKPGSKDDTELANAAVAEWKLIKKQIKEVGRIQADRLEQSMVTGRRWKVGDFETLLARHPLMSHLVRQLVWAAYDNSGKRISTFRVTEERDYADATDNATSIANADTVGIVHPLELTDAERSAWGESLSDYEIVSPFPQLGRPVYALNAGEETEDSLTRFHGMALPAPSMVFTLEKLGYARGPAMDAGSFDEHSKHFPAADVTAVVHYDGVACMGYIQAEEDLTLTGCQFERGKREPSWGERVKNPLKLGQVSPLVVSEVLADLHILKSKSK